MSEQDNAVAPTSPRDRGYDAARRPNIYYKNDRASDAALLESALGARHNERFEETKVSGPATGPGSGEAKPGDLTNADVANNAARILGGSSGKPMTVGEAQDAAAAGTPITGDSDAVARHNPFNRAGRNIGSLAEDLDTTDYNKSEAEDASEYAKGKEKAVEDAHEELGWAKDEEDKKQSEYESSKDDIPRNMRARK